MPSMALCACARLVSSEESNICIHEPVIRPVGLFFEEVSKMQIEAFEERCDELYGRGGGARRREGTW